MAKYKKDKNKRPGGYANYDLLEPLPPQTFLTTPRLINLCKAYNVSSDTLIQFLKAKGYKDLTTTTLLDGVAIEMIQKQFERDKDAKDKIRGETKIALTKQRLTILPKEDTTLGVNTEQFFKHPVLRLNNNLFEKQKSIVIFKNHPDINSNFTDVEAINICSKMSSSFARNLCKQINTTQKNKIEILYQIHAIANKALKVFGGRMLTFIYGLRNLQFKNNTAIEIKTYRKVIPDFPMISFITNDANFKIAFFTKINRHVNRIDADVRIFSSKKNIELGQIDKEGYVLTKLEKFKPELTLFYEATANKNIKIYSGVETGNCDLCGKELTHPTSLRIGIGPTCAKNNGIDLTIYSYI